MAMAIPLQFQLSVVLTGTADPEEGGVDIRCALSEQDASNRKRCPAGQSTLIDLMRQRAGLSVAVADDDDDDGVFTMPILSQDRSGYVSSLSLSHGSLSGAEFVTQNREAKIKLSLSDSKDSGIKDTPYKIDLVEKVKQETGLEPDLIITAAAHGKLFDKLGNTIYPALSDIPVEDDNLLLRARVVGSVSVTYIVSGQLQTATIPPRPDDLSNNYQSTLWVASTCGLVQAFDIEVPQCYQDDFNRKNVPVSKFAVEVVEEPNYAKPLDVDLNWSVCGKKPAADQATADFFSDAPGTGAIFYPGVKDSELQSVCEHDDE